MSRGLGKFQRAVLEILESKDRSVDTLRIAGAVHVALYGDQNDGSVQLSKAFYESVRRALKSLERKGLVCGMWHTSTGHKTWASRREAISEANIWINTFGVSSLRRFKPLLRLYWEEQGSRTANERNASSSPTSNFRLASEGEVRQVGEKPKANT